MSYADRIVRTLAAGLLVSLAAACSSPGRSDGGADGAIDAGDAPAVVDARSDLSRDTAPSCTVDSECSDGVFCNGVERCVPGTAGADARGCIAANPASACTAGQTCDEQGRRCTGCNTDADHDGHIAVTCGGDDCDDNDGARFPGNSEICDATGHDEDCDACTVAGASDGDADHDGYVSVGCFDRYAGTTPSCDPAMAHVNGSMLTVSGTDCDDTEANVRPNQTESCNRVDDNCDGTTDEGVRSSFFPDCDGDGFGDGTAMPAMACAAPDLPACSGHAPVANNTDCDDSRSSVHPGAMEQCDPTMADDNCDGASNEGCSCIDGTTVPCGSMLPGCTTGVQTCVSGMLGACSVSVVMTPCYADADRDRYAPMGAAMTMACTCPVGTTTTAPSTPSTTDCNDTRADVNPGVAEECDVPRLDENCNGMQNEGCSCANGTTTPCGSSLPGCVMGVRTCVSGTFGTCSVTNTTMTCYADADMDLYARSGAASSTACVCPSATTSRAPSSAANIDCDDTRNSVRPGATEVCNGIDDNCNGVIDDGLRVTCYTDADNDTYPAAGSASSLRCPDTTRSGFGNCPVGFTNIAPSATRNDCNDAEALTPACAAPMHCTAQRVCGCEASIWNNADYLDLETGAVSRGTWSSASDIWDDNGLGGQQFVNFRTAVSWRHLDPASFVTIDASYATGLMTSGADPSPFVSTTVIVVRTASGNLFKLGNPSIVTYMGAGALHFTYAPLGTPPAGFACMM